MARPGERAFDASIPVSLPHPLLVGRAHERMLLSEVLMAASRGAGRLVLLGGEAGIGKTSLARDLAVEAEERGIRFIAGHCFDTVSAPPYGPWLEIFHRHRGDTSWSSAPMAFRGGQLGPVRDQAALFADVRAFFETLTESQTFLLLLEDLHWADSASIELLRSLAPALMDSPILVIATYRHDELPRTHPLATLLPALVREGNALRLDLKRLDSRAMLLMIENQYRLSTEDAARLAAYLDRHTDGNPFFAVELLRALEEEGLLRAGHDFSKLGELARVVVPSLIQQVIDGRVARIGEATRGPLEIAAVIGQEVPLALWARLASLEEDQLLGIVERAVAAHLIEAMRNGTHVQFVHALTREAIYEGVLPPRRRAWHQRIAEALAAESNPNPDSVAFHFQSAGDIRAVDWLQRAADQAQRAYAWLTAAELLRAAAGIVNGVEGQELLYLRLILRIAFLLRFSYPGEAAQLLQEAEQLAARSSDRIASALIAHLRGVLLCYSNHFRAGMEQLDSRLEALLAVSNDAGRVSALVDTWLANNIVEMPTFDQSTVVTVGRQLHAAGLHTFSGADAWLLASAGQSRRAAEKQRQFLAIFSALPSIPGFTSTMRAFALHGLGIACAALGQPDDACQHFREASERFSIVGHHTLVAFSLLGQLRDVELTYRANDPARRRKLANEASSALARAGGSLCPGMSPRLAHLGCLVLDGRWKEADEILRDLPDPGNVYLRREATHTIAFLAHQRSDFQRAWAEIHSLLVDGAATEPGDLLFLEALFLLRLAAELCLNDGDPAQARDWLDAHDRWLAWSSTVLGRAEGQLAWAGWHRAAGDSSTASTCAVQAIALASNPDRPLVRLASLRLLGELETASGQTGAAAAHLEEALALADTCEAPFERACTQLAMAELKLACGDDNAATGLLAEAAAIADRLDALLLRSRLLRIQRESNRSNNPGSIAGLTSREMEILRLLAVRRTNAEIADALFISRRTVTSHVEHIYFKLEVRSRAEAEQKARELGLI